MIQLHETVNVARPVHEAFAYVSDFTTTAEWDSTAISATKLTDGPIATGTEFEVVCALPVGSVTLCYTVEQLVPDQRIVLLGRSRFFDVRDTIEFTATASGTLIDYRAEFAFKTLVAGLAALSKQGLQQMGRESVAGLGAALDDNLTLGETSSFNRAADRMVLPGVSLFSRLGYTLARKHFKPMSAYVGDQHMVITGASSGIGYAAALALAARGAQLTLVMRNQHKAEQTVAGLKRKTGNQAIRYELADLSLMADVDALIARLKKSRKPIDVLINNAGALFNPWSATAEGLEQSFALLLLSPYRLTQGLKPLLAKAQSPRVINVVSGGMYSQKLDVDGLLIPASDKYSGSTAYAKQKRALMVLTQQWAQQWRDDGIVVNAMHPGWADTPGVRDALPQFRRLTQKVLRSAEEGADTLVWLAMATEAGQVSGKLFLDREVRPTHLLASTKDSPAQRRKLTTFLQDFVANDIEARNTAA